MAGEVAGKGRRSTTGCDGASGGNNLGRGSGARRGSGVGTESPHYHVIITHSRGEVERR